MALFCVTLAVYVIALILLSKIKTSAAIMWMFVFAPAFFAAVMISSPAAPRSKDIPIGFLTALLINLVTMLPNALCLAALKEFIKIRKGDTVYYKADFLETEDNARRSDNRVGSRTDVKVVFSWKDERDGEVHTDSVYFPDSKTADELTQKGTFDIAVSYNAKDPLGKTYTQVEPIDVHRNRIIKWFLTAMVCFPLSLIINYRIGELFCRYTFRLSPVSACIIGACFMSAVVYTAVTEIKNTPIHKGKKSTFNRKEEDFSQVDFTEPETADADKECLCRR